MNGEDVHTLADRIFKAIEAKDLVGIRSCYHDDATIWHNYDGHAQTVEENLSLLQRLCGLASSLRYTEVDRKSTRLNSSHIQKSRMPSSA